MKGQAKRFMNHKGQSYEVAKNNKNKIKDDVSFLQLWRYSTWQERTVTLAGCLLAFASSVGVAAAVLIYGQVTSLFVSRTRQEDPPIAASWMLKWFGGGELVTDNNRTSHMDALIDDTWSFAYASIAIVAMQMVTAALAVTLADRSAAKLACRLRIRLLKSVLGQEPAFFDSNKSVNISSTLTDEMERLRAGVGGQVVMCSYLLGAAVVCACIAFAHGPLLTLAGLALVPFATVIAALVAKYQTRFSSVEMREYGVAGKVVEEALAAVRTVRAYGGEEVEVDRYKQSLSPVTTACHNRSIASACGSGFGTFLTYALNASVLALGAKFCVRDMQLEPHEREYSPGVMVTIMFCTFMTSQNITMCQPHLEVFSSAKAAANAIYRLIERKTQSLSEKEENGTCGGDIEFKDVYFNYPSRSDVKVLRGLSLKIRNGECVALVGGSGCGKSTTLQLLLKMYNFSGSITVNGRPLQSYDLKQYRSSIGVVSQEPVLFSGTIRENIAPGRDDVTQKEIEEVAKQANAHTFIRNLPKGYDTDVGERGAQLSGGQKQRIAIARALLRRPAVLLLDEPTSALDSASEKAVQDALDAASVGRTTIVVSHRLSTIVNCNRIVYIEQGAVLEEGTYNELLEKKGAFYQLLQNDINAKKIPDPIKVANENQNGGVERSVSLVRRNTFTGSIRRVSSIHGPVPQMSNGEGDIDFNETTTSLPSETNNISFWQILKLTKPELHLLVFGSISSLVVGASLPLFAWLFSQIYGMFTWSDGQEIEYYSRIYAALFLTISAISGLVAFLQTWCYDRAGIALTQRLRALTFQNFLRQEQAWFDQKTNSVGALCARLATDCSAVQGATGTHLGTVLQGICTMSLGVALAMFYSWKMTLVSLISVPILIGTICLEGYVMKKCESEERSHMEEASKVATEAILNVKTVQSLGIEEWCCTRYTQSIASSSSKKLFATRIRGVVYALCLTAPTIGYAISLTYGGILIATEDMPLEYTILVSEALIYGAWMLAGALSFAPNFSAAKRSAARIIQLMQRTPAVRDLVDSQDEWRAEGAITFSSVSFSYSSSSPGVREIALSSPAGARVALVGPSGGGKSTLLQMLMRVYDAQRGEILIDKKDIKSLTLKQLRSQIGLVQQEPVLFSRTIMENIAYGDNTRTVDLDEVIEAAKQANIHSFVSGLPQGYATNLSNAGSALSGGQKQRVAIARALLRKPRILLLDEATSALDAASDKVVSEALEEASHGRTTIMIAHRLSTVVNADVIYVVAKGTIAESGTHSELLSRRGLYYEMWMQQTAT